jgi:hypothetical protein
MAPHNNMTMKKKGNNTMEKVGGKGFLFLLWVLATTPS